MNKASDQTFIRTQAETFAWAAVAADSLKTMGILEADTVEEIHRAAVLLIWHASQDPKFIGDKLPHDYLQYRRPSEG